MNHLLDPNRIVTELSCFILMVSLCLKLEIIVIKAWTCLIVAPPMFWRLNLSDPLTSKDAENSHWNLNVETHKTYVFHFDRPLIYDDGGNIVPDKSLYEDPHLRERIFGDECPYIADAQEDFDLRSNFCA